MAKIRAKLSRGEIVLPPRVVQQRREDLEAMNRIGLLARKMGGVAYLSSGGSTYDRQRFYRKLLEEVEPGSRDEAILFEKLGIKAGGKKDGGLIYRQPGGPVEQPQQPAGLIDQANQIAANPAVGQLGEFLYRSAYHDPDAIDAFTSIDKETTVDEEQKANEMVTRLANEAKQYVGAAAKAGDFIHGFSQEELTEAEKGAIASAIDTAKSGLTGVIQTVAGAFTQTARVREEALARIAATKYPESYTAFTKLQSVGENLALAYLPKLGPGPKTDTDLRVAREAVFNIKAPSSTWIPQLDATIARVGGVISPAEAATPNTKTPPGTPPAVDQMSGAGEREIQSVINSAVDSAVSETGVGKKTEANTVETSHEEEAGTLAGTIENLEGKANYAPVATKIDKSLVPQDVIDFKPKKNRWVQSDDGSYYILYDAKRTDKVRAAWYRATEVLPNG